jgi:PIN domain nuclease of toxin-antitoxin system
MGEWLLIILDTHIFIWLNEQNRERIPAKILSAIEKERVLGLSAISLMKLLPITP